MQKQVSENVKSCTLLALFPGSPHHMNKIQQATESWLGPGKRLALCIALILLTLVQELNMSGVVVSVQDV